MSAKAKANVTQQDEVTAIVTFEVEMKVRGKVENKVTVKVGRIEVKTSGCNVNVLCEGRSNPKKRVLVRVKVEVRANVMV